MSRSPARNPSFDRARRIHRRFKHPLVIPLAMVMHPGGASQASYRRVMRYLHQPIDVPITKWAYLLTSSPPPRHVAVGYKHPRSRSSRPPFSSTHNQT